MKDKILKNRKIIDVLILILVGFIVGLPLFNSNINVYFDDGIQHIARAYGTWNSIGQNKLFANVISTFANNYGYSWNLFYGPLSTYGLILARLICGNFINAYKFFILICLILSGYFMYKFIANLTDNRKIALLASILYMTFPYHLTDMYTRNALGEFVSFIFIPLVFLGLYNLFYTTENHYYLTIGACRINFNTQFVNTNSSFFFTFVFRIKF